MLARPWLTRIVNACALGQAAERSVTAICTKPSPYCDVRAVGRLPLPLMNTLPCGSVEVGNFHLCHVLTAIGAPVSSASAGASPGEISTVPNQLPSAFGQTN